MSIIFSKSLPCSGMSYYRLNNIHKIFKTEKLKTYATPDSHNSKKALNKQFFTQSLKSMFSSM